MSPERNRLLLCAALLVAIAGSAPAQILAHPGWTRSNSAAEPWYQRAVFFQVGDSSPEFKALASRLDAMQSAGIDAVIVTPPTLPSLSGTSAPNDADAAITAQAAFDSRLNDVDNFTRQATAHGIRILAALPASRADADLAGRARFWLTRGVAGLRLEIPPDTSAQDRAAIAASVRSAAASVPGQRIVLVDSDASAPSTEATPRKTSGRRAATAAAAPQLQVVTLSGPLTAAALRPQLAQSLATPNTLLDPQPLNNSADANALAHVLATLALTANSAALADPAQPLILPATQPPPEPEDDSVKPAPAPTPAQPPPGVYLPYVPYVPPQHPQKKVAPPPPPADPLTVFYAKLAALHHSNLALRNGAKTVLDFDAQNALVWIAKPASPTPQNPPVVVLCNLSARPVEISLADAMKKLNLHGFFLRTLLRSNDAMGAEDIEAVHLAPYAVFIGELRR